MNGSNTVRRDVGPEDDEKADPEHRVSLEGVLSPEP